MKSSKENAAPTTQAIHFEGEYNGRDSYSEPIPTSHIPYCESINSRRI